MTDPPRPSKPLTILTLDGGGLQAIPTLLTLNRLLETIALENGVPNPEKPRPCDVFDIIAGVGAGGWLAILLGRFRMDVTACLSEWYNLMQCIAPNSKAEELRLRLLQHRYYDTARLVEQVDALTQFYGTGDRLFEDDTQGARTRHVFVTALTPDAKGYNLFRSYEIPKSAKLPQKLLDGPANPSTFKISSAFEVTGTAKYFSTPWKEQMASSAKANISGTKSQKPHNITELALDEMWGIYGTDIPLSAVVNIGPGLPNDVDVKQIARKLSWGPNPNAAAEVISTGRVRSPVIPISRSDKVEQDAEQNQIIKSTAKCDKKYSVARTNSFGSVRDRGIGPKLGRNEDDIKRKLSNICPGDADLYYRLTPAKAP